MKTISIFLALINSITAGILLLLTFSSVEAQPLEILWFIAKTVAGTIVILIGIITWLGGAGAVRSGLLPMSSLFLVALGAATTVWAVHVATLTGDIKFHMLWYGGSLLAQGVASLAGLADESKNMIAH